MKLFFPVVFVSLHPHRQERLLSTWPVTEVMWRLSVRCSRLELTLILGKKYVNISVPPRIKKEGGWGVEEGGGGFGQLLNHWSVHCTFH